MKMKEARTANIGLAIWRLKCFYQTFVQGSTAVILLNICAKIRHIAKPKTVVCNIFSELTPKASLLFFRKKFNEIATEKSCVKIENRTELYR